MAPAALIIHTLPTLQLVCHLVAMNNPNTGGTIPEVSLKFPNLATMVGSNYVGIISTREGASSRIKIAPGFFNYNSPTVQLACHMVATSNLNTSGMIPGVLLAVPNSGLRNSLSYRATIPAVKFAIPQFPKQTTTGSTVEVATTESSESATTETLDSTTEEATTESSESATIEAEYVSTSTQSPEQATIDSTTEEATTGFSESATIEVEYVSTSTQSSEQATIDLVVEVATTESPDLSTIEMSESVSTSTQSLEQATTESTTEEATTEFSEVANIVTTEDASRLSISTFDIPSIYQRIQF